LNGTITITQPSYTIGELFYAFYVGDPSYGQFQLQTLNGSYLSVTSVLPNDPVASSYQFNNAWLDSSANATVFSLGVGLAQGNWYVSIVSNSTSSPNGTTSQVWIGKTVVVFTVPDATIRSLAVSQLGTPYNTTLLPVSDLQASASTVQNAMISQLLPPGQPFQAWLASMSTNTLVGLDFTEFFLTLKKNATSPSVVEARTNFNLTLDVNAPAAYADTMIVHLYFRQSSTIFLGFSHTLDVVPSPNGTGTIQVQFPLTVAPVNEYTIPVPWIMNVLGSGQGFAGNADLKWFSVTFERSGQPGWYLAACPTCNYSVTDVIGDQPSYQGVAVVQLDPNDPLAQWQLVY